MSEGARLRVGVRGVATGTVLLLPSPDIGRAGMRYTSWRPDRKRSFQSEKHCTALHQCLHCSSQLDIWCRTRRRAEHMSQLDRQHRAQSWKRECSQQRNCCTERLLFQDYTCPQGRFGTAVDWGSANLVALDQSTFPQGRSRIAKKQKSPRDRCSPRDTIRRCTCSKDTAHSHHYRDTMLVWCTIPVHSTC